MQSENPAEKDTVLSCKTTAEEPFLYELKKSLITETERSYLSSIKSVLPTGYFLQPQVNLASIIYRTDNFKFQNELYRNIDACVFDKGYRPIILIEINDDTHKVQDRKERDRKVKNICEEAGIPLITFWTSYGINQDYISKRIISGLEQSKNPVRIAHSTSKKADAENNSFNKTMKSKKEGCYIATAVYGSYDCPQVMILRQYRDNVLSATFWGRAFIKVYYFVSPFLVSNFANKKWFNNFFKKRLDKMIVKINKNCADGTPHI